MGRVFRALAVSCLVVACGDGAPEYRDPSLPIERRVQDLLARMTVEEKFWQLFAIPDDTSLALSRLAHGVYGLQVRPPPGGGARQAAARINALQRHFVTQTRLGIPMIPFEEALHGVAQGGATVFPQAIALAATWDTVMMRRVAGSIARETRGRGIRQVLSPVVNIATDVRWGRVEETYGEDPFLAARLTVAFVTPFEAAGVVTTPKHFVANVGDGGRDSYPIELSERWLEELHFPPFRAAITEGGARSTMAAYNSVNGAPASASRWLLHDKLRKDMGFGGVVISDAGGVGGANVLHMTSPDYAGAARRALEAGLDVIFQTSADHATLLRPAFERGQVSAPVLDSAVARVLRLKVALGLFERPYVAEDSLEAGAPLPEHGRIAREAASAAITLLTTDGQTLPLDRRLRRVALIGADAEDARLGGYSGSPRRPVSIREGLEARLGPSVRVHFERGPGRDTVPWDPVPASAFAGGLRAEYFANPSLEGAPTVTRADPNLDFVWAFSAPDSSLPFGWYSVRWTGTLTVPLRGLVQLGVVGDDGARLYVDGVLVLDRWRRPSHGPSTAPLRLEGGRRYQVRLEYHQNVGAGRVGLVWTRRPAGDARAAIGRAVAAARAAEVAIVVAGIEEGEFRDRASLRLPGLQEDLIREVGATGRPLVVVLVGGSAITMTDWLDQANAVMQVWYPGEEGGHAVADVLTGAVNPSGRLPISFPRAEGQLPLTYFHKPTGRGDDYVDLTGRALFPFGHGLSYSRFTWRAMTVEPATIAPGDSTVVRLRIRNEGPLPGAEVVQVYLRDEVASVTRPVLMLAAFLKVYLEVAEEREVVLPLHADRFALLDAGMRRVIEPGRFIVLAGASSSDLRQRATLDIRGRPD